MRVGSFVCFFFLVLCVHHKYQPATAVAAYEFHTTASLRLHTPKPTSLPPPHLIHERKNHNFVYATVETHTHTLTETETTETTETERKLRASARTHARP